MNARLEQRLASATDSLERSAGHLMVHGRRLVHDHPTALVLGALLGVAALATVLAVVLLRSREEPDEAT